MDCIMQSLLFSSVRKMLRLIYIVIVLQYEALYSNNVREHENRSQKCFFFYYYKTDMAQMNVFINLCVNKVSCTGTDNYTK